VFAKPSENLECDSLQLLLPFREDENVVHVDANYTLRYEISEDVIHHRLEGCRAVRETKEHHQSLRLKETAVCTKSCLLLITFANANIVVPPANIKLHEILRSLES